MPILFIGLTGRCRRALTKARGFVYRTSKRHLWAIPLPNNPIDTRGSHPPYARLSSARDWYKTINGGAELRCSVSDANGSVSL